MKDGRIGYKKLLAARNYKGSKAICGRIWCLPAKQKSHRATGRKANTKFNSRKALDVYISRFYYQAAFGSRI